MFNIKGEEKQILGKGNLWIVKEIQLDNPISINGNLYNNVACKFSLKKSQEHIDQNLRIYQALKKSNIPTLEFMDKGYLEDENCLITENLANREDILFVSPNTLRNKDISFLRFLLHKEYDYVQPKNETCLFNRKIDKIINFNDFLKRSNKQIRLLSGKRLDLCEDALFLGVDKKTWNEQKDWVVADFDNIKINYAGDESDDELFNKNMHVFF